jgi:hypothetical protein
VSVRGGAFPRRAIGLGVGGRDGSHHHFTSTDNADARHSQPSTQHHAVSPSRAAPPPPSVPAVPRAHATDIPYPTSRGPHAPVSATRAALGPMWHGFLLTSHLASFPLDSARLSPSASGGKGREDEPKKNRKEKQSRTHKHERERPQAAAPEEDAKATGLPANPPRVTSPRPRGPHPGPPRGTCASAIQGGQAAGRSRTLTESNAALRF